MFAVGEVVAVFSKFTTPQPKHKYHLCICAREGLYLFINTDARLGDFEITKAECAELPNEKSFVCCSTLLRMDDKYLKKFDAKSKGSVDKAVIRRLLDHIEESQLLSQDEKDEVIDSLADAIS